MKSLGNHRRGLATRTGVRLVAAGAVALLAIVAAVVAGRERDGAPASFGRLDAVWGERGISDGRLQKPRAMTVNDQDEIFIVDMTARVQVFDVDGRFLRGWRMPVWEAGKPTGISIDRDGRVLVGDTHYYRLMIYTPSGELVQSIGGTEGRRPGEFGLVTDAVQDARGNYYVAEYGDNDRIQKFTRDGRFLLQWGGLGSAPGQFARPQSLEIDEHGHIWVADACNHRIQVFDQEGKLVGLWGTRGGGPGEMYYPYDIALAPDDTLYVCEYGNHRVQKFTRDGRPLGTWGREGRAPGELFNPWALVRDSRGRLHVLDTNNHRVQRVRM